MNGALVSSFERWRDHIIEEQQLKKKAFKVVQRMLNGALVTSFEKWKQEIVLKAKALKVLKMWSNRGLATALTCWMDAVDEIIRMRGVVNRVLMRWTHGCLTDAWNTWTDFVLKQQESRSESMLHVVSLEMPFDYMAMLASASERNFYKENVKMQVCSCLNVPTDGVQVLLVPPTLNENGKASSNFMMVKVVLSDVLDSEGNPLLEARDCLLPLCEAAVEPTSQFANISSDFVVTANSADPKGLASTSVVDLLNDLTIQLWLWQQRFPRGPPLTPPLTPTSTQDLYISSSASPYISGSASTQKNIIRDSTLFDTNSNARDPTISDSRSSRVDRFTGDSTLLDTNSYARDSPSFDARFKDSNSNARYPTISDPRSKDSRFKGSITDDILTFGQYAGGIMRAESPTQKRSESPTHKPWRALDFVHDSLNPAYVNAGRPLSLFRPSNSAPPQRSPDSSDHLQGASMFAGELPEFHAEIPKNHVAF
jgi:hypothetical protein